MPTPSPRRTHFRDPQDIRDLLPYQANRLMSVGGAPVLRWCEGRFGISRRQWRVLAALAPVGTLRSSVLAEQAELDRTRTSRTLKDLEQRGLIQRQPEPGNARHVQVVLTAAGQAMYAKLWPMVREHHLRLVSVLTAEQLAALEVMLERLLQQAMSLQLSYDDLPKANRRRVR